MGSSRASAGSASTPPVIVAWGGWARARAVAKGNHLWRRRGSLRVRVRVGGCRAPHLLAFRHGLHIVLHHALEAGGRLEGGARGVGVLRIDKLRDRSASVLLHCVQPRVEIDDDLVDVAWEARVARLRLVHIALCEAAVHQQRLQLVVLHVGDHGAPAGVGELAYCPDGLLCLPRSRHEVDRDCVRAGDAERREEVGEVQRIGVLKEVEPADAACVPPSRRARRVQQEVHITVAVWLRGYGERVGQGERPVRIP